MQRVGPGQFAGAAGELRGVDRPAGEVGLEPLFVGGEHQLVEPDGVRAVQFGGRRTTGEIGCLVQQCVALLRVGGAGDLVEQVGQPGDVDLGTGEREPVAPGLLHHQRAAAEGPAQP